MAVPARDSADATRQRSDQRTERHVEAWIAQSSLTRRWLDEQVADLGANDDAPRSPHNIVAQLVIDLAQLIAALDEPTSERPRPFATYAANSFSSKDHALRLELAQSESFADLINELGMIVEEITDRLTGDQLPKVVRGPRSTVTVSDLLRLSTVEWLAASSDLSRTNGSVPAVPLHKAAVADGVRSCASILSERYPGGTIEVRVPPYAAVQIALNSDGPAHTRGTPPNVVETDPETFLRLATGREQVPAATRSGHVRASGIRSDISPIFPLF